MTVILLRKNKDEIDSFVEQYASPEVIRTALEDNFHAVKIDSLESMEGCNYIFDGKGRVVTGDYENVKKQKRYEEILTDLILGKVKIERKPE